MSAHPCHSYKHIAALPCQSVSIRVHPWLKIPMKKSFGPELGEALEGNSIPLPIIPLPSRFKGSTGLSAPKFFIRLIAFRAQTFIVRSIHAEK